MWGLYHSWYTKLNDLVPNISLSSTVMLEIDDILEVEYAQ